MEEEIVTDNLTNREIQGFKIKCPQCTELIDFDSFEIHRSTCEHEIVTCPEGCRVRMKRKLVAIHLSQECLSKLIECDHCHDTFPRKESRSHFTSCMFVPQPCQLCEVLVTRRSMENHINTSCMRAYVSCPFKDLGCEEDIIERLYLGAHLQKDVARHLTLLFQAFYTLCENFTKLLQNNSSNSSIESFLKMLEKFKQSHLSSSEKMSTIVNDDKETEVSSMKKVLHCEDSLSVDLRAKVISLEQQNKELTIKVNHLEQQLEEQKRQICKLCTSMSVIEERICNGIFFWKIKNFSSLAEKTKHMGGMVCYSPGFYTSPFGYKACLRLFLQPSEDDDDLIISLFLHFMRGDYDDLLSWPFQGSFYLIVISQTEDPSCKHIVNALESNSSLQAFHRPKSERNVKGYGYKEFTKMSKLYSGGYIKNETLIIKIEVVSLS
ncbi:TNF receptor-associated factor 6-like [Limulus polyphemus]|uniref:TNF receptor-associated factor 6-like n=1 Tax=Limulus polyphemus TaxID=6850 RepID=A0ABM1TBK6_LIMPO|nr:TNF receptor-associated factor 6-like [Limulus polyphemus]XP_013785040.1 TNF receptor-associated factor 6-like [Limulus polyphemus]XP_022253260.1 TNF receptor-associated factor 6-like [Limulus polyphemus]XP_022253261.1 TNF receptor-associated factor 6-like [Limulus polyphemus]XP_022253262.1 TNF receptor-associated factor 6-like [Limulus polyphemus]